jgi:hypothetical protein
MKLDSMSYLVAAYQEADAAGYAPVGFRYYDSRVAESAIREAEEEASRQERMGRKSRKLKK